MDELVYLTSTFLDLNWFQINGFDDRSLLKHNISVFFKNIDRSWPLL